MISSHPLQTGSRKMGGRSGLMMQGPGFVVPELSVHDPQHWSLASGAPGWIDRKLLGLGKSEAQEAQDQG